MRVPSWLAWLLCLAFLFAPSLGALPEESLNNNSGEGCSARDANAPIALVVTDDVLVEAFGLRTPTLNTLVALLVNTDGSHTTNNVRLWYETALTVHIVPTYRDNDNLNWEAFVPLFGDTVNGTLLVETINKALSNFRRAANDRHVRYDMNTYSSSAKKLSMPPPTHALHDECMIIIVVLKCERMWIESASRNDQRLFFF